MARHSFSNLEGDIVNWYRGAVVAKERAARGELERSVEEGAEIARGIILTVNTTKSGPGRVESGDMVRDIDHRVDDLAGGGSRGFFGWLNAANSPGKDYYVYQEGGFTQASSGQYIQGMYAIADAADAVIGRMRDRITSAVKTAGSGGLKAQSNTKLET